MSDFLKRSSSAHTAVNAIGLIVLALQLSSCSGSQPIPKPEKLSVQITAYNHTQDYIHQYYIDGEGGGNVEPYGSAGFICCGSVPEKWNEGMKATVKWTTSSGIIGDKRPDAGKPIWHEKQVLIEPYSRPVNYIAPHFLPNGEVRLIVSRQLAAGQGYPGPPKPVAPPGWKK